MFSRVISLVNYDNFKKIQNKCVLIVGIGGVGGYACEALVRSGIKKIIIIDYDIINESNLNRQIITNKSNILEYKVIECEKRLRMINPECDVISLNMFLNKDNINILDKYNIDYIIDANDTVDTKKILIDYIIDKDIKFISSMGTAKKIDPLKLSITDIRKTSYDPLARIIRKYVISKNIKKKIMVVSSCEEVIKNDDKELASLIFVPATAGILLAKYVINDIITS